MNHYPNTARIIWSAPADVDQLTCLTRLGLSYHDKISLGEAALLVNRHYAQLRAQEMNYESE